MAEPMSEADVPVPAMPFPLVVAGPDEATIVERRKR